MGIMNVYLLRWLPEYSNTWQYEEFQGKKFEDDKPHSGLGRVLQRLRARPEAYRSWSIYRVSDMRCIAQSKEYKA